MLMNTFLTRWDKVMFCTDNTPCQVMLLATTNRPQFVHKDFLRRMPFRVKLRSPGAYERTEEEEIFVRLVASDENVNPRAIHQKLAARFSPRFSASDVAGMSRCAAAATARIRQNSDGSGARLESLK